MNQRLSRSRRCLSGCWSRFLVGNQPTVNVQRRKLDVRIAPELLLLAEHDIMPVGGPCGTIRQYANRRLIDGMER